MTKITAWPKSVSRYHKCLCSCKRVIENSPLPALLTLNAPSFQSCGAFFSKGNTWSYEICWMQQLIYSVSSVIWSYLFSPSCVRTFIYPNGPQTFPGSHEGEREWRKWWNHVMEEDFVCLHGAVNVSARPACANPTDPCLPPRPLELPFFVNGFWVSCLFSYTSFSLCFTFHLHPHRIVEDAISVILGTGAD